MARRILSDIEIRLPCSEFIRLFLAIEAREFNRHLNAHINFILKQDLLGKIPQINESKHLDLFFKDQNTQIKICLYASVLKGLGSIDNIELKIQQTLIRYLIFILNDTSEETKLSKKAVKETRKHIAKWERESRLFDEIEAEFEAGEEY